VFIRDLLSVRSRLLLPAATDHPYAHIVRTEPRIRRSGLDDLKSAEQPSAELAIDDETEKDRALESDRIAKSPALR